MATSRLIPLHVGKGRTFKTAIRDIVGYVENPDKTEGGQLVTGYQCNPQIADAEFLLFKNLYRQKTGRERGKDDVIAYHLRQSFVPGEITPEEANRLGQELARRFTKGNNAYIVATHTDKAHIHNHIIVSAVTLDHSRKFRNFWGSTKALHRLNDTICIENGYSVVENPKRKGKSYDKWLGDKKPVPHRERLCQLIDELLSQKPQSFEALLDLLRQAGYEVKGNPENPSLRGGSQKRFVRMDTLGPGYSAAELRAVIAGEREHIPKKRKGNASQQTKTGKAENPVRANQLLIDIQKKMAQGKGAGYAHWAKRFNLKQMSQTVAYLQEHNLMDYADLCRKADAASEHFHALSAEIKDAETRMAEIAVLRTHILNYVKTRDTYAAYRKAGYSKKFLAENEGDILLHKAAKQHFDSLGLEKLPTVKRLQGEYAELLKKKKAAYGEYRKARDEMRELVTARANIEQILGKDTRAYPSEQEKTGQR